MDVLRPLCGSMETAVTRPKTPKIPHINTDEASGSGLLSRTLASRQIRPLWPVRFCASITAFVPVEDR